MSYNLLRISSLAQAENKARNWAKQVISLIDIWPRHDEKIPTVNCDHLVLRFDDVDDDNDNPVRVENSGQRATLSQIKCALDFASDNSELLVHCHGGICRSPALAIAILVKRGMTFEEAIKTADTIQFDKNDAKFCMWPNGLIIKYADEIMHHNGKLIKAVEEWKKTAPSILSLM